MGTPNLTSGSSSDLQQRRAASARDDDRIGNEGVGMCLVRKDVFDAVALQECNDVSLGRPGVTVGIQDALRH